MQYQLADACVLLCTATCTVLLGKSCCKNILPEKVKNIEVFSSRKVSDLSEHLKDFTPNFFAFHVFRGLVT